jgi:uncharacterized OsmC-like protein
MAGLPDYLTIKHEALTRVRTRLSDPSVPATAISATARVAGSSGVRPVRTREFTVITDSAPVLAGHDLGPTAPELLLSALASCLAHTYVVVGISHGLTYQSLEVEVRGCIDYRGLLEVDPAASVPPTELTYQARIASDASAEQLETLRQAVERLCPVLQALQQPTPVLGQVVRAE